MEKMLSFVLVIVMNLATKKAVYGCSDMTYSYDKKGRLTIFWKGGEVFQREVKKGGAYAVRWTGEKLLIYKEKLPKRNNDLLKWLLSFSWESWASTEEEYRTLVDRFEERNAAWLYRERSISGDGYAFTAYDYSKTKESWNVAAYIGRKADKELVKEVIRKWTDIWFLYYPKSYVESVLKERFHFTDEEWREIKDRC